MLVTCLNCSTSFEKLPGAIKKSPRHYCSRSCAQSMNNRLFPKRVKKAPQLCPKCSAPLKHRHIISKCRSCYAKQLQALETRPLSELLKSRTHRSNRYDLVRSHVRKRYENERGPCEMCGYSLHTEICHIKPIASFPLSATLAEINARSNIRFLCPNHHWEFDNLSTD